jgi:hypothetical protein
LWRGADTKQFLNALALIGDRDIRPRDVISRKLIPRLRDERIFFIRHALRAGFTHRGDFQPHENRPRVPGADQRDCGFRGRAGGGEELNWIVAGKRDRYIGRHESSGSERRTIRD